MSRFDTPNPWSDAEIAQLRTLQAEGLTAVEIGRRIGRSKSSVHGVVRPLKAEAGIAQTRVARVPAVCKVPTPRPGHSEGRTHAREPMALPGSLSRPRTCQWPLGHPRTPGFRFCDRPDVVFCKPYCAKHYRVAYVPVRSMRETAGAE